MTTQATVIDLLAEVQSYRYPNATDKPKPGQLHEFAIPLELTTSRGDVNLITTTMAIGMPQDITVSELAIECFFPQDHRSAEILRGLFTESIAA